MKILRTKLFGAVKRVNKAKKKAWEISRGRADSPELHENWAKELSRAGNLLGITGAQMVNIIDPDTGERIDSIRSHSKDQYFEKHGKISVHDKINAKATFKGKGEKIPKGIIMGEDVLTTDYFLSNKHYDENDIADRLDASRKGTIKSGKTTNIYQEDYKRTLNRRRAKASKDSIAKHKIQAEKLRADNKLGVAVRDAKRFVKKNPGKSAALGLGTAAVIGGTGYAVKKAVDKKKDK